MQKTNKIISLVLITVFSIFLSKTIYAQENTTYFIKNLHQSHYTNPAFQSNCSGFIGLPAISAMNVDFTNTGFAYKHLIHQGEGDYSDSLIIDLNGLKEKLGTNNYFFMNTHTPVLGLGFWIKDSYFTFDIANKTNMYISYPGNLIKLIDGNGSFIGANNPLEINDIAPNASSYNEYSFGLSKRITHRLTIGGKFKLLGGIANISSKSSDISITTGDITYDLDIATDLDVKASFPIKTTTDNDGNITGIEEFETSQIVGSLFSFKNFGAAFDLGANYQFNDKIKFFASITDLGFISWKRNSINLKQNESFSYSGMGLEFLLGSSEAETNTENENENGNENEETEDSGALSGMTDSLMNFLKLNETNINYFTSLPTNIYIGGTYEITNSLNLGLLSKTYFYNRKLHQAVTLSANLSPAEWFSTTLSYSMMNRSYNNIGLGFAIKGGPFQFYLVTDNLNTFLSPKSAKSFNLMFGLNIIIGCGKRTDFSTINNKGKLKEADFM